MLKAWVLYWAFNIKPKPAIQVAHCPIMRIYHLEKGTLRHKLAQESLLLIEHRQTPSVDYDTFTDNGDLTLSVYYEDLCLAYSHDIRLEEYKKLRSI